VRGDLHGGFSLASGFNLLLKTAQKRTVQWGGPATKSRNTNPSHQQRPLSAVHHIAHEISSNDCRCQPSHRSGARPLSRLITPTIERQRRLVKPCIFRFSSPGSQYFGHRLCFSEHGVVVCKPYRLCMRMRLAGDCSTGRQVDQRNPKHTQRRLPRTSNHEVAS
jgi:hypothetical protein